MDQIDFAMRAMLVCLKWRASVTSWGRTQKRNEFIKGLPESKHLFWFGMDVVLDDMVKNTFFESDCDDLGLHAIFERGHYHLQPK